VPEFIRSALKNRHEGYKEGYNGTFPCRSPTIPETACRFVRSDVIPSVSDSFPFVLDWSRAGENLKGACPVLCIGGSSRPTFWVGAVRWLTRWRRSWWWTWNDASGGGRRVLGDSTASVFRRPRATYHHMVGRFGVQKRLERF